MTNDTPGSGRPVGASRRTRAPGSHRRRVAGRARPAARRARRHPRRPRHRAAAAPRPATPPATRADAAVAARAAPPSPRPAPAWARTRADRRHPRRQPRPVRPTRRPPPAPQPAGAPGRSSPAPGTQRHRPRPPPGVRPTQPGHGARRPAASRPASPAGQWGAPPPAQQPGGWAPAPGRRPGGPPGRLGARTRQVRQRLPQGLPHRRHHPRRDRRHRRHRHHRSSGMRFAEDMGVNPDGSLRVPASSSTPTTLGAVIGAAPRSCRWAGSSTAPSGQLLDKRILADAPDCWIVAESETSRHRAPRPPGRRRRIRRLRALPAGREDGGYFAGDVSGYRRRGVLHQRHRGHVVRRPRPLRRPPRLRQPHRPGGHAERGSTSSWRPQDGVR